MRLLCFLAYGVLLTTLLLVRHPDELVAIPRFPWGDYGVHFGAFTLLAIVTHAARWPKGISWPLGALVVYGLAIETLQILVPPRTVQLEDYAENLLGIAVGSAFYWAFWRTAQRREEASSSVKKSVPILTSSELGD